ncbi:hypothetical protein ACLKA6_000796 [Drosophila palustris]
MPARKIGDLKFKTLSGRLKSQQNVAKSEALTSQDVDANMRDVSANHRHNPMEQEQDEQDNGNSVNLLHSSDEFVEQQQQQQRHQLDATLLSPFNLKTEPELQQKDEDAEDEEQKEQEQQDLTLYEHFSNASAKDVCLKLQDQNGCLHVSNVDFDSALSGNMMKHRIDDDDIQ